MARGIRATVKARGKQRQRTFPIGTTARTIEEWKDRERVRLLDDVPAATKGTFADDVERYLDTLSHKRELQKERTKKLAYWSRLFGRLRRSDIKPPMIRAALAELRQKHSASYCNHYRTALSHLWSTLDGREARNPLRDVPKFEEPEAEPRDLTVELAQRVIDAMADVGPAKKGQKRGTVSPAKLRLRVILTTGLSHAEIKRIQPDDLHLEDHALYVRRRHKGKGVTGMMLPLTDEGVAALKAFADHHCFGPFSTSAVRKAWVKGCKTLAKDETLTERQRRLLKTAHAYDLRHTHGTFLLRSTKSLPITRELMRHKDERTTLRYVKAAVPEHLRDAIAGLRQPMPPQTTEQTDDTK